jgi:hypothetical protein
MMATTSLWRVKGYIGKVLMYVDDPDKTTNPEVVKVSENLNADMLEDVIAYAGRESATNQRQLVTGLNCNPDTARKDMMAVKEQYGKCDGTIAYHGYQSFKQGEVTPEEAHQIGRKLAEELWADRYQVLVCTHVDKESHLHNHFVINTVSFVDGIKFHRTKEDYQRMREVSDRLCREYGLSVIRHPDGKGKHYSEWSAEKNGKPTNSGLIKADIDKAIKASVTEREFFDVLKNMGYEFKLYRKDGTPLERPSLRPKGAERFRRFDRLGEGYDLEEIRERILGNIRREAPFPEEEQEKLRRYRRDHPPRTKAKGLQALYYYYCYELRIIARFPASARVSFFMREDIRKLDRLDEQTRFLGENKIENIDDLNAYRLKASKEIEALAAQRTELRNKLKRVLRAENESGALAMKHEIAGISEKFKKLRRSLELADMVESRAERMRQELDALNQQQKEKEEPNELFGRSSGTGREDVPKRR